MSDSSIYVVCCGLLIVVAIVAIRLIDGRNAKVKSNFEERKRKLREDMTEDELCEFIQNDKLDQYGNISELGRNALNGLAQRGTEKSIKFLLKHYSNFSVASIHYSPVAWAILVISERLELSIPSDGLFLDKPLIPWDRLKIYEMVFVFSRTVPRLDELVALVKELEYTSDIKFEYWVFLAKTYCVGNLNEREKKLIDDMANDIAGHRIDKYWKGEYIEKEWEDSIEREKIYRGYEHFLTGRNILSYISSLSSNPEILEKTIVKFDQVFDHTPSNKRKGRDLKDEIF